MATSNKKISSVLLSVFLTLVMCFGLFASLPIKAYAAGGTGTPEDPFRIETEAELRAIATGSLSAHYVLVADITLSGINFTPIGNDANHFTGSFDGRGHTIEGLTISSPGVDYQGLFGANSGSIVNLNLTVASISGKNFVGGIVGYNNGPISNCSVFAPGSVTVTGIGNTGGIAGGNYDTITNCTNFAKVTSANVGTGGIVGMTAITGTISSCTNSGDVSGSQYAGGIAGLNFGPLSNCLNTGEVTGTGSPTNSGGIAGNNNASGTISLCVNSGNVNGDSDSSSYTGGIVGYNNSSGTIQNSAALNATVTGYTSSANTNRVVGISSGTFTNNHANQLMDVNTAPQPSTNPLSVDGEDLDLNNLSLATWDTIFANNTSAWDLSALQAPKLIPTHTVRFDDVWSDGASYTPTQAILNGSTATKPADPTRSGYLFAGWYSDQARTVPFDFNTPITDNTPLFAKWDIPVFPFIADFPTVTDNTISASGTIDADYVNNFGSGVGSSVEINGLALRAGTDVTFRSGSVIITLSPSYLSTLANGTYNVVVRFAGPTGPGIATTTLTIAIPGAAIPGAGSTSGTTTNPKTGDEAPLGLLISLIAVAGTALIIRKRMSF